MKYALGTVLGTALLGVAKSKLGSGVRLKKGFYLKRYTATLRIIFDPKEENLDYLLHSMYFDNEVFMKKNSDLFSFMKNHYFDLILDEVHDNNVALYYFALEGVIDSPVDQDLLDKIHDAVLDLGIIHACDVESWNDDAVEYLSADIVGYDYEESEILINVDTGEPYKVPKLSLTKLRKR